MEISSKPLQENDSLEKGKIVPSYGKFVAIALTQRSVKSRIYTLFFINIAFISSSCRF